MVRTTFWDHFLANADAWAVEMHSGNQRKVFDAIDGLLESYEVPFCFDITTDERVCVLIFSPEGDSDIAAAIDALVDNAPQVGTWRFLRRRPRKALYDAAAIVRNLYHLDPTQMSYRIRRSVGRCIVEMIAPSSADLSHEEAQGMVNTFLWHAIGEDTVMNKHVIGRVVFGDNDDAPTVTANELVASI